MVLAADYPFLDIVGTMLIFFAWVIWFWILIRVLVDVFRRHDLSGWGKAGWTLFMIVLPFLGVLIYLIAHGKDMGQRDIEQAQANKAQFDDYVRSTAGRRRRRGTDRAGQEPARQRRDHAGGVRLAEGQGALLSRPRALRERRGAGRRGRDVPI